MSTCNKQYFCYLLLSKCERRTYIGATVNMKRRLRQHNGICKGGAVATKLHRPWTIYLYVSGFSSWSEALKFEWLWKHIYVQARRRYRSSRGLGERQRRLRELISGYPNLVCSSPDFENEHTDSII
jgi:structure-specific endonuclease subunit SLX1